MADADRIVQKYQGLPALSNSTEAQQMADDLIRGAITSLKTPINVPEYEGVDMSGITRGLDKASAQAETANANIGIERDRANEANDRKKKGIEGKGAAEADLARADQEKAQLIANIHSQVAAAMGFDPNEEAAILGAHIADLRPQADAKLKEIQQLNQPGDPLEWIANQFILPSKIQAYNAVAMQINSSQAAIDGAIDTAKNIEDFALRGVPTITTGQAKAKADIALNEATKLSAQADEDMAKVNVTFAQNKLANDLAIIAQTDSMTQIQQKENKQKYEAAINAITLADTHAKRQLEAAKLLEMLEDKNALRVIIANYENFMGHAPGTFSLATFKALKKERQDDVIAIGTGSLGTTPASAMYNFYANKPVMGRVNPEVLRLMQWIHDKAEPIATNARTQAIDEKQKMAMIDMGVNASMQVEINDAARMGSLFYEFSPAKMISSGAIPANTPLAKILEPLANTSGNVPTEMVLQTILKEVKNPNEAGAAIAAYYQKNMELRNSTMNTQSMGVKLPATYTVRDSISPIGFFKAQFDLTKPADATKWILFQQQKKQVEQGRSFVTGVN